jgi:hypothetical protein
MTDDEPLPAAELPSARVHFERARPAIEALLEGELRRVGVDAPRAVSVVLGSLSRLRELQGEMSALPGLNVALLDSLESVAMAAWYSHLMYVQEPEGKVLEALLNEATELRAALRISAEVLALRGVLDAESVAAICAGSADLDVASDLTKLATLFQQNASILEGRTAVSCGEIERAATLGPEVLMALSMSHREDEVTASARSLRVRALTLLELQWDEVRKAVGSLRWTQGDAQDFAPSLRAVASRHAPLRSDVVPSAALGEPTAVPAKVFASGAWK